MGFGNDNIECRTLIRKREDTKVKVNIYEELGTQSVVTANLHGACDQVDFRQNKKKVVWVGRNGIHRGGLQMD